MTGQRVDAPRPAAPVEGMAFLRGETFEASVLPGGLTNRNYRIDTVGRGSFVARVAASSSGLLAIDRDAEAANSTIAAQAGVAPRVVEYAPARRVLVVEWVNGRTFSDADLDDAHVLEQVAATCRQLHAGRRFCCDFDMFAVQRRYLQIVLEHRFRLPDDYLEFTSQVRLIEQVLAATSTATVPCHNDLLAANILDDGARIWFIDFEYSGNNDAAFELGNIWSEAALPLDRLEHLVACYCGAESAHMTARARLYGLMSKYGWTLWAAIQDAVSDVDFDFWQWGMDKYHRAVAEFRSPDFANLIDTVRTTGPHEGVMPWQTPPS